MNKEFTFHVLNESGKKKAQKIAQEFDALVEVLKSCCPANDSFFRARESLELACFHSKKAMAQSPENHE